MQTHYHFIAGGLESCTCLRETHYPEQEPLDHTLERLRREATKAIEQDNVRRAWEANESS